MSSPIMRFGVRYHRWATPKVAQAAVVASSRSGSGSGPSPSLSPDSNTGNLAVILAGWDVAGRALQANSSPTRPTLRSFNGWQGLPATRKTPRLSSARKSLMENLVHRRSRPPISGRAATPVHGIAYIQLTAAPPLRESQDSAAPFSYLPFRNLFIDISSRLRSSIFSRLSTSTFFLRSCLEYSALNRAALTPAAEVSFVSPRFSDFGVFLEPVKSL